MSDALPVPPRPNLEHYKKLAKELVKACKSGECDAIRSWTEQWLERLVGLQVLTPDFRHHLAQQIEKLARNKLLGSGRGRQCALADAQFVIARAHGFASWPKFSKRLEALARANSLVSKFEAAVDAIVSGDSATLEKLLSENPQLVRARSTREHRSTLLHYVTANGVEDFRQKTPKNIVEITKLLLKAGADVNAESEAYGGRSTTLGLAATSWHPENVGVQLPLMEVLIAHGAIIDGPDLGNAVNGCLHNGRGEAAEFFARRGGRLDLEGAAGVGRLDVVKSFFNEDGSLKPNATMAQLKDGFAWACEYGRTSVVDFLLQKGIEVSGRVKHHGQTGLHWAACGGHVDTVKLLLERKAPVDAKDDAWDNTPLGWALHAWGNPPPESKHGRYYEVVALLVAAGTRVEPEWLADENVRADSRLVAALRGEKPG